MYDRWLPDDSLLPGDLLSSRSVRLRASEPIDLDAVPVSCLRLRLSTLAAVVFARFRPDSAENQRLSALVTVQSYDSDDLRSSLSATSGMNVRH